MDFNKLKEMGLEYAEKGKNAAMDLAERGKTQAKIVSEQAKLAKAQRQLGALVYSLAKGNEENQPLVDKYIEMIDSIEQELASLKEALGPAAVEITRDLEEEPVAADAAQGRLAAGVGIGGGHRTSLIAVRIAAAHAVAADPGCIGDVFGHGAASSDGASIVAAFHCGTSAFAVPQNATRCVVILGAIIGRLSLIHISEPTRPY